MLTPHYPTQPSTKKRRRRSRKHTKANPDRRFNSPNSLSTLTQHLLLFYHPTMQFFKSTLFVAVAAAAFVAAAPSPAAATECLNYALPCTENSECCSNECIAS
ncbi:hypothetical protein FIBSPDRAFT_1037450, partial [Athelia psychrophila]